MIILYKNTKKYLRSYIRKNLPKVNKKMEYHGRRNRRGRPRTRPMPIEQHRQKCSVLNNMCSFLILTSLIAIVYLMLDYHSNIHSKKYDFYNITRSIDDITHNMSNMKNSYLDLERNVLKLSQDLPKIEGQVEILEALAHSMERGDFVWNPKTHLALPYVDVFMKSEVFKELNVGNSTTRSSKFTQVDDK